METKRMIKRLEGVQNVMDEVSEFKHTYSKNESEAFANATVNLGEGYGITVRCKDLSYDRIMALYCSVLFDIWNDDV